MSDASGIYFFFALFCGVQHYDPQIENANYVIEQYQDFEMDHMGFPTACWLATDPGFPAPWSDLPGADPVYYDI